MRVEEPSAIAPLVADTRALCLCPLPSLLRPELALARPLIPDPLEPSQDLARVAPVPLGCHQRVDSLEQLPDGERLLFWRLERERR